MGNELLTVAERVHLEVLLKVQLIGLQERLALYNEQGLKTEYTESEIVWINSILAKLDNITDYTT